MFRLIYYLIFSLLHVFIMLLFMTLNGYVILAIILGYSFGYLAFGEVPNKTADKECYYELQ